MFIKRLYIGDFGIFHNESVKELHNGIVVVGGLNRAGKSSLLKVLTNLGYGFTKVGNLPSPISEYYIEADLEKENKIYNLKMKGYGEPIITPQSGSLYNIDKYTYKELFTIDLDRLNNFSKGDKELYSILLGAGLKEVIKLPNIIEQLKKEGEKIGGKQGNPSTKLFKPYYLKIKEASLERDEALKEKKLFLQEKEKYKSIIEKIEKEESNLKKLRENIALVDLWKNNYKNYIEYKKIKKELEKDYNKEIMKKFSMYSLERVYDLKEEHEKISEEYSKKIIYSNNILKEYKINKEMIIKSLPKIEYYFKESSGIKEKYKNLLSLNEKNKRERENIKMQINNANSNVKGNLDYIMSINSDLISINYVVELIEKYRELKEEKKDISNRLNYINNEENLALDKVKENRELKRIKGIYYIILLIFCGITTPMLIASKNKFLSLFIGISMVTIGIISFYFLTLLSKKDRKIEVRNERKDSIKKDEERLKDIENKIDQIEKDFNDFREILKLNSNISYEGIKEYLIYIQDIKFKIQNLYLNENKEMQLKNELKNLVDEINLLIQQCYHKDKNFIKLNEYTIFDEIEKLLQLGNIIKEIKIYKLEKEEIENKIKEYLSLNHGENIEEILYAYIENIKKFRELEKLKEEENKTFTGLKYAVEMHKEVSLLIDEKEVNSIEHIFEKMKEKYSSLYEIEEDYKELLQEKDILNKCIEELKEKKHESLYKIKRLEESSNLEKSQGKIYDAKRELKPLAEKYAILKASSFILEKVYESFLNEAKDNILKDASSMFNKITSGEYEKILPGEDLNKLNFKTLLKHGEKHEDSSILSRGTREGLFFSVRLSRIMELEPMPIIIDDSLVNFDSKSLKSTIKILKELSKRNQIFILTCHSKLIELIEEDKSVQYIKLNAGEFSHIGRKELIEYLE